MFLLILLYYESIKFQGNLKSLHKKNGFVQVNLNTDLKKSCLTIKIIYIVHLNIDGKTAKSFNILTTNLDVLHNHFDSNKIIIYS